MILAFNFFSGIFVWFWYQDDGGPIEVHSFSEVLSQMFSSIRSNHNTSTILNSAYPSYLVWQQHMKSKVLPSFDIFSTGDSWNVLAILVLVTSTVKI